ncbi:hypothetical protein Fmac_013945 [Flemingia macrophylla]|uniref:RING-type domain-containing protein n=1 Tax=Flemingia macrophylla TaxID=520843 RepID=A0ABD1MAQ8_9FABA
MGLSNFPSASEGVLPVVVMKTVVSVAVLKSMLRWMLQVVGGTSASESESESESENNVPIPTEQECSCERRASITRYKYKAGVALDMVECCVCLSGFQPNQEVSELPCKHFFHRGCLDKWFAHKQDTCPLCRSI